MKLDGLTSISIYLQKNEDVREFASEYTKFVGLLLTSPQTVCVAERSFSDLRRLKSYVQSTMGQRKINDLGMLFVHSDIAKDIDLGDIVDEFISKNSVRRNTFAFKSLLSFLSIL